MLIIDMPMPKESCYECPCADHENGRCQADKDERYYDFNIPKWCPIKGVLPEEHGDLVDADTVLWEVPDSEGIVPPMPVTIGDVIEGYDVPIVIAAERKEDSMPSQGISLPCWADGPDGCEELTYHGMAECLRHCIERNGTDCRHDCQYVERDTGACLHEYLMSDAADYLDKAAATIEKMKKANIVIAAERKDDEKTAD